MDEYSFGSWLRRRRRALDLTQQELARRVSCSLSTIAKIEGDQRRPSRQIAELLAQHLSIPENQVGLFLKVARGLRPVDRIPSLPIPQETLLHGPAGRASCPLPAPPTPLVGRKPELAEILRLLALPDCRLLTVVGLGGIGKTRLALQVVQELGAAGQSLFPDGLCFVSLASTVAAENIPKAIAQAIAFDLSGPSSPEEQLLGYLHHKRLLLLLDNAEHLLDGAESFSKILARAPEVKLLVTSRERLNLRGEWVFDLQGLPVPPLDAEDDLEDYSAAKLFLERARQVQRNFSLQERERPAVASICHMLDGIPLGIELAAAWVRTLPVDEIAAEIARDLGFLTTSARDIPERHRSLRVVFDHSWNLLSPAGQRALQQLSGFRGGFTRKAAQEVAETDLTTLNSLIDRSLLRRTEPARYDVHETVRGYAAGRLAEQPADESAVRARHSRYYLSLVREAGQELHSDRQKKALARLALELSNIRSAWAWALDHRQIELLDHAAQSLWYLFELRNYYREAEVLFGRAAAAAQRCLEDRPPEMAAAEPNACARSLGKFLMYQAYFAMRVGQVDRARACCREAITLLRPAGDPVALAHALTYYAVLNWTVGKLDRAWELLGESLPLSKEHGPPWQIALFTGMLGNVAYERGEYDHSYRLLNEALERSQRIGDPRLIGFVCAYLGRTALKLERSAEIEDVLWRGAQMARDSGDRYGRGLILEQLALVARSRGDFTAAEQLFEASVDLFRETGDAWSLARALISWGHARRSRGDLAGAAGHLQQAVRISLEAGASLIALSALAGLARVYARDGRAEAALEIALCVSEHPASTEEARCSALQLQRGLATQLTPDQVAQVRLQVRAASPEELARRHL